jgi:hypothetical protein
MTEAQVRGFEIAATVASVLIGWGCRNQGLDAILSAGIGLGAWCLFAVLEFQARRGR